MQYMWVLVIIVLTIIEINTTDMVSIWFILSSVVALVLSFFTDNIYIQIGIFVLLGVALIPISRKLYKKYGIIKTKTNIDRIIGMKGIVTEEITLNKIGEVKVDGKRWSAVADTELKKDTLVKILKIDSTKLKVEKWEEK